MTLYCISGLGADARAFQYLIFPEGIKVVHLQWIPPAPSDTMKTYAAKMMALIDTSTPYALLGLSFGGMLATEMLDHIRPQKTILLSSIACKKELPLLYRFSGMLKLNKLLPKKNIRKSNVFTNWLFSIDAKNDGILLQEILMASNPSFTHWAINAIVNWQREEAPAHIIRIHGTKDHVLPIKNFKPVYTIEKGGHFMVANRAGEISAIIKTVLCN
ncbi:MAG: alpha/beta hydrolase [Bacteroidetes bacterium]|nr:alpha/beta hydrolase [Bacteroidota bacterium]